MEPKNTIEVNASRVMFDGRSAIIATEVKKGDEVVKQRDGNGVPALAGWRRHRERIPGMMNG